MNVSSAAATDEPAVPSTEKPVLCSARLSDRLSDSLIDQALEAGRDVRPGRTVRRDGWTPERIRIFLSALAECGVVEEAAGTAGMSCRSAYNLRNSAKGTAFRLAWDGACQLARRRVADILVARALHGCVRCGRDAAAPGSRAFEGASLEPTAGEPRTCRTLVRAQSQERS